MIKHIHMPLDSALEMVYDRWYHHRLKSMFGYSSIVRLRNDLKAMKAQGLTVVSSADCDRRSATGECLGHPDKLTVGVG